MAKHISIPIENTVEIVNVTPVNPLVSKCEIKVCYVGEQANRNGSVITKETAIKMAATLPGCPIAGYYSKEDHDFRGHSKQIEVGDGKFRVVDLTKPYGFVDSQAKIWFQKFQDDGVEHEYLMTEGTLWTELYEEAKEIIDRKKPQSMELDEEKLDGNWTFDDNGWPQFFIINEAIVKKLCVLGDDVEPCFEGAGFAAQFSFDGESFKNELFSLMENIKSALSKGGFDSMEEKNIETNLEPEKVEEPAVEPEFKKKEEDEKENPFPPKGEEKEEDAPAEKGEEKESEEPEEDEDDKKKKKSEHSLSDEDIIESQLYKDLQNEFTQLQQEYENLKAEVEPLRQFKADTDKKAKEEMINRFYMLSDAEKKDCVDNIDTYSLDDIEAKLSIICVRNKVSFSLEDDKNASEPEAKEPVIYDLNNNDDGDSAPAWIKAVRETAKEMN